MDDAKEPGAPFWVTAVWGARLLPDVQERPSGYLRAWWDIVNWDVVGRRY